MIIGIRFSDNDFYNTLMPWMVCLQMRIKDGSIKESRLTKHLIMTLFNESVYGFYVMTQDCGIKIEDKQRMKTTKDWLQIEEKHIYLDEEVVEYCKDCSNWDNSEFFYFDTRDFYDVGVLCI